MLSSRSSERSTSGAVEMRLRIWLIAWVRLRVPKTLQLAAPASIRRCRHGSSRARSPRRLVRLGPRRRRLRDRTFPGVGVAGGSVGRPRRPRMPSLVEIAGEPGAVAAGALDPDELDLAESLQPGAAALGSRRASSESSRPSSSDPRSSSAAATWTSRCVSTPPVMRRAIVVIVIPSFVMGGWHRTERTTDRTAMGLCGRLL